MGRLTRDEVVSEGQLLAGRDDNATASAKWLQRWLDSIAAAWPWPQLQTEAIGINLPSGTTLLTLGAGSGGITALIQKVLDNVWCYTTDRTARKRVRIRHQLSDPGDRIQPTSMIGFPGSARLFYSAHGQWQLSFDAVPDKDYLLTIPYLLLPAAMSAGTDIPWYPNDETMVQAVAFKNHEFYDGKDAPVTQAAQAQLAALVANDRIRFGTVTGINDALILDPTVFKPVR